MSFCSVSNLSRTQFSCFSGAQLQKIARAYNDYYPDKIKLSQNIEQLNDDLTRRLSNQCSTQYCWLKLPFVQALNDPELERSFNPEGPVSPQTAGSYSSSDDANKKWLSTDNISKAMKRFEEIYPDFLFFGPVPIDFAEIFTELNKLNLKRLYRNGITKIGIVFNFDPHTEKGSHWVALMADLSRNEANSQKIAFFDSYGTCPPRKEISDLIDHVKESAKRELGMNLQVLCNKTRHQFSSSECGVYSMYFLEKSLEGVPFMNIFTHIVRDDEMNKRRARYFRPEQ